MRGKKNQSIIAEADQQTSYLVGPFPNHLPECLFLLRSWATVASPTSTRAASSQRSATGRRVASWWGWARDAELGRQGRARLRWWRWWRGRRHSRGPGGVRQPGECRWAPRCRFRRHHRLPEGACCKVCNVSQGNWRNCVSSYKV